jgi:pimeloyl-ACP methyl ester carboxylesterase
MPIIKLSNGARLNYGDVGSGPTMILVHGSPGEGSAWMRVIKHLPPSMRVLMPDLPGYGGSDPLPSGTTLRTEAMAQAIGELMERCTTPIWLCGHSYGGNVALHAAIRCRDLVEGLVLIEPVFMRALDLAGERDVRVDAQAFFTTYLVRAEFAEPEAIGLMIDFWCGAGSYAKLPFRVRDYLNEATARNAEDVRGSFSEAITDTQLEAFDRPVLIAYGSESPAVAGRIASALAKLLPLAEVLSIPGATHALLDSHPLEVAKLFNRLYGGRRLAPIQVDPNPVCNAP